MTRDEDDADSFVHLEVAIVMLQRYPYTLTSLRGHRVLWHDCSRWPYLLPDANALAKKLTLDRDFLINQLLSAHSGIRGILYGRQHVVERIFAISCVRQRTSCLALGPKKGFQGQKVYTMSLLIFVFPGSHRQVMEGLSSEY